MDAIVCGHICLDLTPTIGGNEAVSLERFFRPGALNMVEGIEISPGGAVSNTGLALTTLGFDTVLVARSGADPFAELLSAAVEERGGHARLSQRKDTRTSYSIIIAPPGHDRVFLHDPGANEEFTAEDVTDEALSEARVLHYGYPTVMPRIYSHGGRELAGLYRRAREAGVVTSLDTALPDPDSESGRVDWKGFLDRVLPEVDVFFPSFEEIAYMIDRPLYEAVIEEAGSGDIIDVISPERLRPLGEKLVEMGATVSGIKAGHLGIYMRTGSVSGGDAVFGPVSGGDAIGASGIDPAAWSNRELFVPSFAVQRVASATGAGDSSIAGILAALMRGEGPERALRMGSASGASACMSYDPTGKLGHYDELAASVDAGWDVNDVPGLEEAGFRFDDGSGVWVGPSDGERGG
jgi:sugar/nucleoside kinase (ribokinase family)